MQPTRRLLDPALHDLSPRHLEIYWRYQVVRTGVDFGAAFCFVFGSVLFFYESTTITATWFFLIGSILFAVKPTIDMVRSLHLQRLPDTGHTDHTGHASSGAGKANRTPVASGTT